MGRIAQLMTPHGSEIITRSTLRLHCGTGATIVTWAARDISTIVP